MNDPFKFQAVCMAYEIVTHPEWKQIYDECGWGSAQSQPPSTSLAPSSGILKAAPQKVTPRPQRVRDMRERIANRQKQDQQRTTKPSIRWNERVQEVHYELSPEESRSAAPKEHGASQQKKKRKPKIVIDNLGTSSSRSTATEAHGEIAHAAAIVGEFFFPSPQDASQDLRDSVQSLPSGWSVQQEDDTLIINNVNDDMMDETDEDDEEQAVVVPGSRRARTVRDVVSLASSTGDVPMAALNTSVAMSEHSSVVPDPNDFFDSSFLHGVVTPNSITVTDNLPENASVSSDSLGSFVSDVEFEEEKKQPFRPFDDISGIQKSEPPASRDLRWEEKAPEDGTMALSSPLRTLQAYSPGRSFQEPHNDTGETSHALNDSRMERTSRVDDTGETSRALNHSKIGLDIVPETRQHNKSFDEMSAMGFSFKSNRSSHRHAENVRLETKQKDGMEDAEIMMSHHSEIKERALGSKSPFPLDDGNKQITLHRGRSGVSEITGYFTEGPTQDTDTVATEELSGGTNSPSTDYTSFFTCYIGSLTNAMTKCGEDFANVLHLSDEQFNSFVNVLERRCP